MPDISLCRAACPLRDLCVRGNTPPGEWQAYIAPRRVGLDCAHWWPENARARREALRRERSQQVHQP